MLFSLITCTYNPNPIVFSKLINAVRRLRCNKNFSFEWLIVDNGVNNDIESALQLKDYEKKREPIIIIKEPKAGLTNARITGISHSKGSWILFLDDDNEPKEDYLINTYNLILKYPFVKCWGPGNVNVVFMDLNVKPWISSRKDMFQEKHIDEISYSNQKEWCTSYPNGTGMVIEKNILLSYIDNINNGTYTLTDRLGKSLSSGGDTQIVFHVVRNGIHAGISPDLVINHNIEERKSKFQYLKKQFYAGCKSFIKAHNEVLTENRYEITFKDNLGVAKRVIRWMMKNYKQLINPIVALDFFNLLGSLHSPYFVINRNPPILLRIFIYIFVGEK